MSNHLTNHLQQPENEESQNLLGGSLPNVNKKYQQNTSKLPKKVESDSKNIKKPISGNAEHEESQNLLSESSEESISNPNITNLQKKGILSEKDEGDSKIIKELLSSNKLENVLKMIDQIDLNLPIDGKPLLNILCQKFISLKEVLKDKKIEFKTDNDNRTALHYAIEADDVKAAFWCFENKIENTKDNYGKSAFLDAIRFGRRRIFLLCLHYKFYDSEAPHYCAKYNRLWELKVLRSLGYEVLNCRDYEHFTPLERAAQNQSYEVVDYLSQQKPSLYIKNFKDKAKNTSVIQTIRKGKPSIGVLQDRILPVLQFALRILIIYLAVPYFKYYSKQADMFNLLLFFLEIMYAPYILIPLLKQPPKPKSVNFLQIVKSPEFPLLEDICPECIQFTENEKTHCSKCEVCVQKLHFHTFVCVNKQNQLFWLITELILLYLAYILHSTMVNSFLVGNFSTFHYQSNIIFLYGSIIDQLIFSNEYAQLVWFIYLTCFFIYQIIVSLIFLRMMYKNKTYYSFIKKVKAGKQNTYGSKSQKPIQNGVVRNIFQGFTNAALYFFK